MTGGVGGDGTQELPDPTGDITITVTVGDEDNTPVDHAKVTILYANKKVDQGRTDANGHITFTDLPYGTYNIEVKYQDQTVTKRIDIVLGNVNLDIRLPESNVNSTVSGDKHVVPDNLEEVFKDEIQDAGNNSTVDLNINAEEQKDMGVIGAITDHAQNKGGSNAVASDFVNVTVTVTVTTDGVSVSNTVSELPNRLTFSIELNMGVVSKIINNSEIKTVVNQTQHLSVVSTIISIEYGESLPKVELIIRDNIDRIKAAIPQIVEGPFYKGVTVLGASSVNLLFMSNCKEEDYFPVSRAMNRELKLLFDEYGINIPFPQVVVNQPVEFDKDSMSAYQEWAAKRFVDKQAELSKDLEDENN